MSFNETKLYSVLNNKCPRCHKGEFFVYRNPYKLSAFTEMNLRCTNCGEDFRKEPGYYFGSSYVSYGLTVGFGLFLFLLVCVILDYSTSAFLWIFGISLLLLLPIFYRTSRLVWINLFVKYNLQSK